MPINYYDSAEVVKTVNSVNNKVSNYLLDLFARKVFRSKTKMIDIGQVKTTRRLAPIVAPSVAGVVHDKDAKETKIIKPAYVKDKRVFEPGEGLETLAGESRGGNLSPTQRRDAEIVSETFSMIEGAKRRMAFMLCEALRTGKVTVKGKGMDHVVDFGRNPNNTFDLTGTNRWGQSGVSPLDDIEDWIAEVQKNTGYVVNDVIFGPEAWKLARKNAEFKELLDTDGLNNGDSVNAYGQVSNGSLRGRIGQINLHTFQDIYEEKDGTKKGFIGDYDVIIAGVGTDIWRCYGAIQDKKAGLKPLDYFVKMWENEDPSVEYLMLQSAPLPVLGNPDASMCVTVHDGA